MPKPTFGTFAPFYANYIALVNADSVKEASEKYGDEVVTKFKNLPSDKTGYRYAPGKWTIIEVLQHIIDAERIFAYRALCIARKESTSLPGFDENTYAENSRADSRSWDSLLIEFEAVRKSTDLLFGSFNDEQFSQVGLSNNNPISVNTIAFIAYGHILHHLNIIEQRYL